MVRAVRINEMMLQTLGGGEGDQHGENDGELNQIRGGLRERQ
jgi:hypothetical protein